MIRKFTDILERMRHLNKDQKTIFYEFCYENNDNISLLSIPEKKGLHEFCSECVDLLEYLLLGERYRLSVAAGRIQKLHKVLNKELTNFINKE